jgi:hypothetical protein
VTGAILIAAVSFDKLQQMRGGRLFRPPHTEAHGPTASAERR